MSAAIVVPFQDAERKVHTWAREEASIDWTRDHERAGRCVMAFAATELEAYLSRSLKSCKLSFASSRPEEGTFVELRVRDVSSKSASYELVPDDGGVVISGHGRTGVLYGAYELLRLQGWRWYAPGGDGTVGPPLKDALSLPTESVSAGPDYSFGRGFRFTYVSMESEQMLLWMARNRLNLGSYRSATGPLGHKLGMIFRNGGHIFEEILNPDRYLPSGNTIWEENPEWYGLPPGGARQKHDALKTQFCVSQPELIDFLSGEILARLSGEWREADHIDVWGFDTWGNACTCEGCRKLGNGSDRMLHFLSQLRTRIDEARRRGRLDHDTRMAMCAYEGTATLQGPVNPFPRNLTTSGDYVIFYPINRCYAHDIDDADCRYNDRYLKYLRSWFDQSPGMPVLVGEYYNVSKFEDLPLVFSKRICADLSVYHDLGAQGISYMHPPLVNWGVRALNHRLYAALAWDTRCGAETIKNEYFDRWYGAGARSMRRIYELIETAWEYVADWRAWSHESVLSKLLAWDGTRPAELLTMENHLAAEEDAIESGRRSVALMREAMNGLSSLLVEMKSEIASSAVAPSGPTGPNGASGVDARVVRRVSEVRRQLIYGIDTMTLMTEVLAYHRALYNRDAHDEEARWKAVEETADRLDSYYVPIDYEEPGAGLMSRDALTRTQLGGVVARCRAYRHGLA